MDLSKGLVLIDNMDESIDYFLADLETEETESVHNACSCHHDTESPEKHLVSLLHLLRSTVQRTTVDWLRQRIALKQGLDIIDGIDKRPETDTSTSSSEK